MEDKRTSEVYKWHIVVNERSLIAPEPEATDEFSNRQLPPALRNNALGLAQRSANN
jgi:hypothetical protein